MHALSRHPAPHEAGQQKGDRQSTADDAFVSVEKEANRLLFVYLRACYNRRKYDILTIQPVIDDFCISGTEVYGVSN